MDVLRRRVPLVERPLFGPYAARTFQVHRALLGALAFFVLMMVVFIVAAPTVFLQVDAYTAVFVSLPLLIILAAPLVFVVASGEIDLSFPSTVGITALVFAETAHTNAGLALVLAILAGIGAGAVNAILVLRFGLSSLVATLGMYFFLRGIVQLVSQGIGIPLDFMQFSTFDSVLVGRIGNFPVQMLWGLGLGLVGVVLFNRHKFGAHIRATGDNTLAATEMGIDVRRTKTLAFMYVGASAAVVGVLSILININFFPTVGDGLLLTVLAAVFVGGTPAWGGVGTVAGAIVGAFTISFIEPGIIASGLTGFYTQFFYGLVIILSLVGHRFAVRQAR
jgi:simple sugar transport system permease protein